MTRTAGRGGDHPDASAGGVAVDRGLVRALQRQVADRLTRARQDRLASGEPELQPGDDRQLTVTLIHQEVAAYIQDQVNQGRELPDPAVDAQLARAVEAAIFGAGAALQPLLDDPLVENIDINGTDVWVTYSDARGKMRAAPVADTDEDLIDLIATLAAY